MHNIKQKILKNIISFALLVFVSSCQSTTDQNLIKKIPNNKFVEIALILPISGPDADLGKEYAKMIKLGLSNGASSKIRIVTYDSASQETLAESLEKILEQDIDIIIGPIYSEPTRIAAEKLKSKKPIIISLSNNPVLAEPNIFVSGHAPMKQLLQLTNHFLINDYQNYIILMPQGRHSSMVSAILKDMISKNNANLASLELYDNTNTDSISESLKKVSNIVDELNEDDNNLKQTVVIMADDPILLKSMLKAAKDLNLDTKAVLAGDNRIDIAENTYVTFTSSIKFITSDFSSKLKAQDIKNSNFMHSLAYDAGIMIGTYIGPEFKREDFINKMNNQTFEGVSGIIKFTDSIALRKYDIIHKKNGVFKSGAPSGK